MPVPRVREKRGGHARPHGHQAAGGLTSCEGGAGPFLSESGTPCCKAPPATLSPCPVVSCSRRGGSAGERTVDPQGARDKTQQGRSP